MNTDPFPNLKGTLFIVTYGRSGSTLLQSLLQTIPESHIAGENFDVLDCLFRAARRAHRARRVWGKEDHGKDHPWYNADRIRPVRFENELVDAFIREVLRPPKDVRWFGFKEIRFQTMGDDFASFLNFYRRTFHNAFFVFNSRNVEDVVQSAWWKDMPRDEVTQMVQAMDTRFATFAANNPDCSHHVFYEEIVRCPASMKPLFDKLGEPFDLEAVQKIMDHRLTH